MLEDRKQVGPVTAAIRAMRDEEMAACLADISGLAMDAGNSIIALLNAMADGQLVKAFEEGGAATAELACLAVHVQAAMGRLEAA